MRIKKLEPYAQVSIFDPVSKKHKELKVVSNTAYYEQGYYKINGNEFLKILNHYKEYATYASKENPDVFLGGDYVKIAIDNEEYQCYFDPQNDELHQFAENLFNSLKYLIDYYSFYFEDLERNIVFSIKDSPVGAKFKLDDYFKASGIISHEDKILLSKNIEKRIEGLVEIDKKPFRPRYLHEMKRI